MKTIRTLLVSFDNNVPHHNISAFRGAIIEKVGRENLLFNHHIDNNTLLYRYPLIQYKSIRRKPAILCLGDGVDEIHKLFNKSSWEIDLRGKKTDLVIDNLNLNNFRLNIWDKSFDYRLYNWFALNEKNYQRYNSLTSEMDRLEMLERILIGNILAFAKGMDWHVEQEIRVRIREIRNTKQLKYKNTHLMAFDVNFSSNVFLPNFIGLGKGASHGYGVVRSKHINN